MTPEKEEYYEKATRTLLKTIDEMGLDRLERIRAKNLVLLFRDSFKLPNVKYETFRDELGDNIGCLTYDSEGFCRVASINFALMMGNIKEWQLMYINELWTYGAHHYLMHMPSKTILDLTYDQFTHYGIKVPYSIGYKLPLHLGSNDMADKFASAIEIDKWGTQLKKQNG